MRATALSLAFLAAFSFARPASAIPITWQLDALFLDGVATATGTFVYDADTNMVSDVNITTDPGPGFQCSDPPACTSFAVVPNAFPGTTYDLGFAVSGSNIISLESSALPDLTGSIVFNQLFQAPLTNAGGVVGLVPNAWGEYVCQAVNCDQFSIQTHLLRTMNGTVTAVPEPTMLWLVSGGLAAAAWRRRRR